MAPRAQSRRLYTSSEFAVGTLSVSQAAFLHDANAMRHRKTGVSLANIGERDEYGLQPLENVFSSPNKAAGADSDREDEEDEDDDSGSEEMELADPQSALRPASRA